MILLSRARIEEIESHGEREFPNECCGVILGDFEKNAKVVRELRPLENRFQPDHEFETLAYTDGDAAVTDMPEIGRERRYLISPDEMFALLQEERRTKRKVLGFYHSHPNHPAQPSIYDFKASFPWYSYLIVSVMEGEAANLTAWKQDAEGQAFEPEEIILETKEGK